jgi:ABC-type multidrug transport system fused ATPase/permease subunit
MASPDADTTFGGKIEEVDVKGDCSPSHVTMEAGWHVADNHQQNLSFSDVRPADIAVRNLEVEVDIATSLVDRLKVKFAKPEVDDVEGDAVGGPRCKKVLKDVSADFPAGTLTAIIGGSGSGKVVAYLKVGPMLSFIL